MNEYIVNKERYYLINKEIINEGVEFFFDLYGKNTKEENVSLVSTKSRKLIAHDIENLSDYKYLYVHESEKKFYENYYKNFMTTKLIPKNMKNFYEEVGNTVNNIFENPTTMKNVKEVESIVNDMVSTILHNDFSVSSFITILASDYLTHTHSLNVSVYSLCLGKHMGMNKKDLENLGVSALLHDLGKTQISDKIINKEGILTEHEFNEVKKHPMYGWAMARQLGVTNKEILSGIRNHHERVDGTGYPDKQKDEHISIFAKIIAVCDVFDALTTNKSYKNSTGTFNTLVMMKKEMSKHLDGDVVNHFIGVFKEEMSKIQQNK
ncbi:metal dependent phosphohydrolase [Arcobacter nitrofigilis DSM 7299]|uniref:Metal dependent phosphohydrolase n=1 Tax=Arcobacter nitrofigilis (strain ATCC 33309 / DSM 7299 / CCUG 15893 / LMG 7604 / NCTC 12251 / CI) TaxID=572480 RepID=D5V0W5_ARCNC|nr:HD-GYP domain-containing protein [Arcobacter nitrofigilis]ADG93927.1 metal dependent phosphohydrolase [Arcobacter nitrofigilis DSM 7299]